jgi:hypothetical protein
MARSKNRVLSIDAPDGKFITVQLQLENGEVVIAGYKRALWIQATAEVDEDTMRRLSNPPVAIYGKASGPNR